MTPSPSLETRDRVTTNLSRSICACFVICRGLGTSAKAGVEDDAQQDRWLTLQLVPVPVAIFATSPVNTSPQVGLDKSRCTRERYRTAQTMHPAVAATWIWSNEQMQLP
ncbi:hypothetical protein XA68_17390 [Ophiocordyceps unilateralis]|uniref:Uncharacterized protein n=1 Tax=Ophiocordyceps unilateralis TaxID=268505 RepID=A0A2A9P4M3_OPHUN|nr:hypothetical protein XA68_17390 [Ophiocordyceps unilateralis]